MTTSSIRFEITDRVGTITLNRPEVMNAFGGTMREDLLASLAKAAADPTVRCVIITGSGSAFSAGGDIANMRELQSNNDATPITARMEIGARVVHLIRDMPKPVIAAVNGAAAGAGMNLALACDLRYASSSAKFAASFVKIGLVPDWAGHYLLTRVVGTARAMELMMLGERIDAQEAWRLGIVNRVLPAENFQETARELARQFAHGPAAALAAIKRGVYLGAAGTLDEVIAYETIAQRAMFLSDDAREGMRAFMEKRAPRFAD
ncbi:MAG: enoyl-CoA hydratase/isomerase family protein [Gammaproteobacteria bacterium]|nr:enoyl-CoA hydratase/isomerase family protein [Gammaproteobacteria bacterium]